MTRILSMTWNRLINDSAWINSHQCKRRSKWMPSLIITMVPTIPRSSVITNTIQTTSSNLLFFRICLDITIIWTVLPLRAKIGSWNWPKGTVRISNTWRTTSNIIKIWLIRRRICSCSSGVAHFWTSAPICAPYIILRMHQLAVKSRSMTCNLQGSCLSSLSWVESAQS